VKAIILSAGQGRRLLPQTATRPKCLIEVGGQSVLAWQLRVLSKAAIRTAVVVVGFGAAEVERHLRDHRPEGMEVRALFNPRFDCSDNLVSCLAARAEMREDFLLMNGDTLFDPAVVGRLSASRGGSVLMALGRKAAYDADDMKVACGDGLVTRIGKDLPAERIGGEAIGVSLFRDGGPRLFVDALEDVAREADADRRWYLSALDRLAARGLVHGVAVDDLGWAEIDYPRDLVDAGALVAGWADAGAAQPAAAAGDTVTA